MNNWIAALIRQMLSVISPELRKVVTELVNKLEADAKKTPNPWDDIFVGLLKYILDMKG